MRWNGIREALGFAGARCGAVAGPPAVINLLNAVQAPYALATPVVECVEDALQTDHLESAKATVAAIVAERQRLAGALREFPFVAKVWPSDANFLLVRCTDAGAVMRYCREHKVLLRHFGGALDDCVRVSVGTAKENDALLSALAFAAEQEHG